MRFICLLLVAFLAGLVAPAAADPADALIRTENGPVQGAVLASGIRVFKGIPYAAPPTGELRWSAPRPASSWEGVRNADKFGNVCMQTAATPLPDRKVRAIEEIYGAPEREDGLYLNIWAPLRKSVQHLPVLVWIYGGGYSNGGASRPQTDGEAFARDGIVFVSFNYRGGVLGYLTHPELTNEAPYHASGNYGSLDQIAALKWIQKNIAAFGGDPSNVTLFGQSAGSGSINMLQASPLARGLFSRVIGESTSQLDFNYGGINGATQRTFSSAEKLGLEFQASLHAASLSELRRMPAQEVSSPGHLKFYPIQGDGYFLPETVYAAFVSGHQSDVAVIAGSNADEGLNLRGKRIYPITGTEKAAYQALYGSDLSRTGEPDPPAQSVDDALDWQAQKWAALEFQTGTKGSYAYYFSHIPPIESGDDEAFPALKGAFHGAEIPYVFDNLDKLPDLAWTDQDRKLATVMHSYWVNYARRGDPNGPGLPAWPRYDPAVRQMMLFSDTPHAGPAPRAQAWDFLNAYYGRTLSGKPD